eukprot:TRINITY_DN18729_c0_g2_i2.p3 TRINITY_DN18729_c0_g2~~TRINITY_DN18729_c0_g2_i2.p3  ORF type:complete len:146 (-),score=14.18 TRINITY_DN18729_c0_g2_i2:8-445(-)
MSEQQDDVGGEIVSAQVDNIKQLSRVRKIEQTKVMMKNGNDTNRIDVNTPTNTEDVSPLARSQSSEDEFCNDLYLFDVDLKEELSYLSQMTNFIDEMLGEENMFKQERDFLIEVDNRETSYLTQKQTIIHDYERSIKEQIGRAHV